MAGGLQFHTFTSKEANSVSRDFEAKGITVKAVNNLRKRRKQPSSVYIVTVPRSQMEAAYKVVEVCGIRMTMSSFNSRNAPPQCRRCQKFAHSSKCSTLKVRCTRCAGEHSAGD